ncbi:Hypothetical predicted protein [Xyrichtys novacula]|uniref:Uncharacterized protein n=1 Tax=Xyrichtys novacula TaxID=13765 RepID=A0AAV1GUG8_XYRNO|nr:Hypothetical predicted protein [Xyrichtys novacula]
MYSRRPFTYIDLEDALFMFQLRYTTRQGPRCFQSCFLRPRGFYEMHASGTGPSKGLYIGDSGLSRTLRAFAVKGDSSWPCNCGSMKSGEPPERFLTSLTVTHTVIHLLQVTCSLLNTQPAHARDRQPV